MSEQMPFRPHLRRELALYRYSIALEQGDFATVAIVLQQAEQDAILASLLAEWDQHLIADSQAVVGPADPLAVRQVLEQLIAPPPSSAPFNGQASNTPALPDRPPANLARGPGVAVPPDPPRSPLPHAHLQPDRRERACSSPERHDHKLVLPSVTRQEVRRSGRMTWMAALLTLAALVVLFALLFRGLALSQTTHPGVPSPATSSSTPTPPVHGKAAYLIDADTGRVLLADQIHQSLSIASTAEIMTAILAIEQGGNLANRVVPITQAELDEVPPGASVAQLQAGDDNITLLSLLYALMLPSGGDAAIVVAHVIAGSTAQFVALMNDRAHALGLSDTHFTSPSGLEPTYSSVADLVTLAHYAMEIPTFAQIVGTQHYDLPPQTHRHAYSWNNTNQLLGMYAGADGIKTGSSSSAGFCLVFSATRNGRHLIGAELGAPTSELLYTDTTRLLTWGLSR